MENKKSNKIIIIILIIFILGLSAFIVYDKLINTNEDNNQLNEVKVNNDKQPTSNINYENLLAKFIGTYQYGEKVETECSPDNSGISDYAYLEINGDGTYTFEYGTNCGSGYSNKGNYAISNNKIYLFNDECQITKTLDGECTYQNCTARHEIDYTETDETINITTNHFSAGKIKLEKNN